MEILGVRLSTQYNPKSGVVQFELDQDSFVQESAKVSQQLMAFVSERLEGAALSMLSDSELLSMIKKLQTELDRRVGSAVV